MSNRIEEFVEKVVKATESGKLTWRTRPGWWETYYSKASGQPVVVHYHYWERTDGGLFATTVGVLGVADSGYEQLEITPTAKGRDLFSRLREAITVSAEKSKPPPDSVLTEAVEGLDHLLVEEPRVSTDKEETP